MGPVSEVTCGEGVRTLEGVIGPLRQRPWMGDLVDDVIREHDRALDVELVERQVLGSDVVDGAPHLRRCASGRVHARLPRVMRRLSCRLASGVEHLVANGARPDGSLSSCGTGIRTTISHADVGSDAGSPSRTARHATMPRLTDDPLTTTDAIDATSIVSARPALTRHGSLCRPATAAAAMARLAAWTLTAMMGSIAITQALGVTGHPVVYVLQALTPFVLAPALPFAVLALAVRRHELAFVNAAIAGALLWLTAPVALTTTPATATPAATRTTVAHANTYYRTVDAERASATLLSLDVDVLAITEFSSQFGDAFDHAGGNEQYPFAAIRSPGDRNGIALFSRHPIIDQQVTPIGQAMAIDATVLIDGAPVRIVVVHPLPGTDRASLDAWSNDLRAIDRAVDPDPGTILLGDFNATRWHPGFRDLLDEGWVDAHEATGQGWSMSWPTDVIGPPFVRIDHALLGDGMVAERVRDLDVPGSDHRAFVVDVALPRSD